MTLEQWAYIGDIVASIAVIASLAYLGVQLRNGNREARARTIQAAQDSEIAVGSILAEHVDTWDKVATGRELTEGKELRLGILLINLLMTEGENRYLQYRSGFLDPATWESRRKTLVRLVNLPIYSSWRPSLGALNHSTEFMALLDRLVEEEGARR